VEKLIISVHEFDSDVDGAVDRKIAQTSLLDWVAGLMGRM
jgi:hypothetical protein